MNIPQHIAKHIRELHRGTNFTWSNLEYTLTDVNVEEASKKIYGLNTIARLTYHINYYVRANIRVLEEGVLDAHDKFSFDHPLLSSENDWKKMVHQVLKDGDRFSDLVKNLPEEKLTEIFLEEKYQDYYHNLVGVVEHAHYHLGQIVIIKRIIRHRSALIVI